MFQSPLPDWVLLLEDWKVPPSKLPPFLYFVKFPHAPDYNKRTQSYHAREHQSPFHLKPHKNRIEMLKAGRGGYKDGKGIAVGNAIVPLIVCTSKKAEAERLAREYQPCLGGFLQFHHKRDCFVVTVDTEELCKDECIVVMKPQPFMKNHRIEPRKRPKVKYSFGADMFFVASHVPASAVVHTRLIQERAEHLKVCHAKVPEMLKDCTVM